MTLRRIRSLPLSLAVAGFALALVACDGRAEDPGNSGIALTCVDGWPHLSAGVTVDVHDSLLVVSFHSCLMGADTLEISAMTCTTDGETVISEVDVEAALIDKEWLKFDLPYKEKPMFNCEFAGRDLPAKTWFAAGVDETWEAIRSDPDSCLYEGYVYAGESCDALFLEQGGMFVSVRFNFFE